LCSHLIHRADKSTQVKIYPFASKRLSIRLDSRFTDILLSGEIDIYSIILLDTVIRSERHRQATKREIDQSLHGKDRTAEDALDYTGMSILAPEVLEGVIDLVIHDEVALHGYWL